MKPWHKNYKDNVAHEIDTSQYHSMIDVFQIHYGLEATQQWLG